MLIHAYGNSIFPWFSRGEPILWWSIDPRCVIYPQDIIISRSMRSLLRKDKWSCSLDTAFPEVIRNCQKSRPKQKGTWITSQIITAYQRLFDAGIAHSVEVWEENVLVGGLYGLSLGPFFFGESMFSRAENGSKVALILLSQVMQEQGMSCIDCQTVSPHLISMGAKIIPRSDFRENLRKEIPTSATRLGVWSNWWSKEKRLKDIYEKYNNRSG